jgi:MoaA/NifB/PqqE/SkfB family radical SAM enzyme
LIKRTYRSKRAYLITNHLQNLLRFELARYSSSFVSKVKSYPYSANFNVTNNCNSRCITCNQWTKKSENELTASELKDIFDQLTLTPVKTITFAGGEPLLRRDIFELVEYASSLGFYVSMVTNGLLVDEKKVKKLIENGLNSVCISIDGTENVHDGVRGIIGAYKKTLSALEIFANCRNKSTLHVNIATTLMRPTLDTVFHVVHLAEDFGASISFNLLDSNPYFFKNATWKDLWVDEDVKLSKVIDKLIKIKMWKPNLISNSISSLEYARKYFRDPLRKDIPCYLGYIELFIGPHGELYPCWALKPIGNLRDKKLCDILNSETYKRQLNEMWTKKCPGCSCGYIPNLDFHVPAFLQELSTLPRVTLKRILAL